MVSVYHSHRNAMSSLDLGFDKSSSSGGVRCEEVPLERRAVIWCLLAVVCATPTCTLAKIHGRQ